MSNKIISLITVILLAALSGRSQSSFGKYDTLVTSAIVYNGDTIEAKVLAGVYIYTYHNYTAARAAWTRLRNAVYVTYPYAQRAGIVFNDINKHIAGNPDKEFIRKYISTREKELKKEFADPLTNLSVYQGKVLMKLINRETGNSVYDILKEYKGGFNARFWQTIAFFFGSNLKQSYDAKGADSEIESIVKEVRRMYGYNS
jgi:hypothetical protein